MTDLLERSEIAWDASPTLGEDVDAILWYGTTASGKRVYERYVQSGNVFDAETGEEIETTN